MVNVDISDGIGPVKALPRRDLLQKKTENVRESAQVGIHEGHVGRHVGRHVERHGQRNAERHTCGESDMWRDIMKLKNGAHRCGMGAHRKVLG